MLITVRVKPNARKNAVAPQPDGSYLVSVSAPPSDGKANDKLIELLSEYFHKPKRLITIKHGASARSKVVEIG